MESNSAQLRRKYPTIEVFNSALKAFGSQMALAVELGMCKTTLYYHKRWLEKGSRPIAEKKKHERMTNGELDAKIMEMCGSGYTEVKVYKLTEEYMPGQIGNEGLEYIRTETSLTALSLWERSER